MSGPHAAYVRAVERQEMLLTHAILGFELNDDEEQYERLILDATAIADEWCIDWPLRIHILDAARENAYMARELT